MTESDCIFCKITAGRIPALRVFENEHVLAFLDIGPLAEGHLLIVPKEHCERLEQMSGEHLARVVACFPRLARAVMQVTGAPAYNLLQSNGREASQVVRHVHFHLIPRRASDSLGYRWSASTYPSGRGEEVCRQLQAALQSSGP